MSKRRKQSATGTMLELWRPPRGSGEAVGCLATTYTFDPGLFDEQCLARFLEIESEPNREDLAFLLERESRLGGAYAGVLVDHTQAGVDHSLRWDVLPVRIAGGKQHAKISLLVWTQHIRVIVASANLTEPGYRFNHEVTIALDFKESRADLSQLNASIEFFRALLRFVPGAEAEIPEVKRALVFLQQTEQQISQWENARPSKEYRQHLVFTLPNSKVVSGDDDTDSDAQSSMHEAIRHCRRHGGSPSDAWIASPFYDIDSDTDAATSALCKSLARGSKRRLTICVPALGEADEEPLRLAAPASLRKTPGRYSANVDFEVLPQYDADGKHRQWHAKMLSLRSQAYTALMVGSSNFTRAGMGIGSRRNSEANVLSIAERGKRYRRPGELESVWPEMIRISNPDEAEWLGPKPEIDEEQRAQATSLPAGFLSATYCAGDHREIILRLNISNLPEIWSVRATGRETTLLIDQEEWEAGGKKETVVLKWKPVQPPEKLLVSWPDGEAFLPLNVEDAGQLPPPVELANMSADDMLLILAASDPSAAFRAWTKRQQQESGFDEELDTAIPVDLDPLRRYDLRSTFLRRIRSRARILAGLRQNLQRPVFSMQALQWRLEGFIGIRSLAERLLKDVSEADGQADEALLTLTDFLIVLSEVVNDPIDGALSKTKFEGLYVPFLNTLISDLDASVRTCDSRIGKETREFWSRVVERCQK